MNIKIKRLLNSLKVKQDAASIDINKIQAELQTEYDKVFKADKTLQADIKALEVSKEYGSDECGIFSWVRASDLPKDATEREYLEAYLGEYGIGVDFENDALQSYQGSCIIITDSGDICVCDDGSNPSSWIVKGADYETEADRNALIEAWMEASGFFPGVFTMDRYGNVFLVNTKRGTK